MELKETMHSIFIFPPVSSTQTPIMVGHNQHFADWGVDSID